MSVTLSWSPVNGGGYLRGGSTVVATLRDVFDGGFSGSHPLTLTTDDFDKLDTLAKYLEASGNDENPFRELADAVLEHGEIIVKASY